MSKRAAIDPVTKTKAEKPVRYSMVTRVADRFAGRGDGNADMCRTWLPTPGALPEQVAPAPGTSLTPYLGGIDHEFRTRAEQVHLEAEADLRARVARRETVRGLIVHVEERVRAARKKLDEFGEQPSGDRLGRRGAAEAHQPDQVINTRNQRRFDAERAPLLVEESAAVNEMLALRREWAELTGVIISRRALAAIRVSRLHNHALRRCRTYERRLVLRHTRGADLVPLLSVGRPQEPDWTAGWSTRTADDDLPSTI